jgi:hypothetical protein
MSVKAIFKQSQLYVFSQSRVVIVGAFDFVCDLIILQ